MRGTHQLRRAGGVSGLLALGLISGCSGKDCCAPPQVLSIQQAPTNSGDQQTATVGSTLPQPLRVLVRRGAEPASGVEVTWSAVQGHLSALKTTTDASGIAVVRWSLDTLAGQQTAGAGIPSGVPPDTAPSVGFSAMANPGPASRLVFQVQPANVFATRPLVIQVAALDRYGNVATDFGGTITVTLGPSGSLVGTASETAVRGVATFGDLSIAQSGTGYTLDAYAAGLTSATSAAFDIVMPGSGRIVFQSNRDGNNEIYSMNADGSGVVRLTNNPAFDGEPAWSPDGTKIAFASFTGWRARGYVIYTMNFDGSRVTALPTLNLRGPAWSHDGARIAAYRAGSPGRMGGGPDPFLVVMNSDGTGQVSLAPPGLGDSPAWSPEGRIAFTCLRPDAEVCVMNADGSGLANLTDDPASDGSPAWSPDGRKIAFVSNRGGAYDVYVMNADGSGVIRLMHDAGRPAWSPDGTKIAFASTRDGNPEIYVMNADGSGVTRLTDNPASDTWPAWSP